MSTIRIPDENMKFRTVRVIDLREDALFQMIVNGQITLAHFTSWVENTRDEWFAIGANTERKLNEESK